MSRNMKRRGNRLKSRRRPPWWFMPAVMSGLGAAGAVLSAALLTAME